MPRPRRRSSTTAKVAIFALIVIVAAGMYLELRGRGGEAGLVARAERDAVEPAVLIANAARARRLVFLGDVPGSIAPKRLAAEAVEAIATSSGLDAVALEIDADLQPWIDRYVESSPEDAGFLLTRPRTLRDAEGTGSAYLEIYRRVWRLNQELGPDRRIRIVAMDLPGWPPERPLSPSQIAVQYARRDAYMAETVRSRILERNARARVLFFADGVHVLKGIAQVQTGGTAPIEITLLAQQFNQQAPHDVFSIIVDAPPARSVTPEVARFRATRAYTPLRDHRTGGPRHFALRVDASFDFVSDMITTTSRPGLNFDIVPHDYRLVDLADGYIFLGN